MKGVEKHVLEQRDLKKKTHTHTHTQAIVRESWQQTKTNGEQDIHKVTT